MFISSMNIKSDNLSIYLSINLSIYPFIYLSIYLCIHLFIYLSIYLSLRPPLPSSVHLTSISQTCNLILASFANNRGPATSHHNRAAPCHRRGDTPPSIPIYSYRQYYLFRVVANNKFSLQVRRKRPLAFIQKLLMDIFFVAIRLYCSWEHSFCTVFIPFIKLTCS